MENKTDRILNEVEKRHHRKRRCRAEGTDGNELSNGHILLEDVRASAKRRWLSPFTCALGLDYERMQFTSDSVPSDITGFSVPVRIPMISFTARGSAMTNLLLADEINRASSKTQSAL